MKQYCIFLLCLLSLACCSSLGEKPVSTQSPAAAPESFAGHTPALFSLFALAGYVEDLIYRDIRLPQVTAVYAMTAEYRPKFIKNLPAGAAVTILAQTRWYYEQPEGRGYYLIKDHADAGLWTGWIEKAAVPVTIKEDNSRFMLYAGFITPSPDNECLAVAVSPEDCIVVVDRSGAIRARLACADIQKTHANAGDAEILGWSDDSTRLWFHTIDPPATVCFGRIDAATGAWELLKNPAHYASNQIAINYNTGDVLYTDFPYQFDTVTAAQTMASKKAFHLYSANFFRPGCKKICTNHGAGFDVRKDPDNRLQYRQHDHEPYRTVEAF